VAGTFATCPGLKLEQHLVVVFLADGFANCRVGRAFETPFTGFSGMYCARCGAIEPEDVAVAKKRGHGNGDPESFVCPHCGGELTDGVPSESARRLEQLEKCGIMSGNRPLLKRQGAGDQPPPHDPTNAPTQQRTDREE
jgi:hypothetical protein